MFNCGDAVVYGTHGVCTVVEITNFDFTGSEKPYYVLQPKNEKLQIYVPCDNDTLLSRMHPVLTKTEIDSVIRSLIESEGVWIENDSVRKDHWGKVIKKGDRDELISMIHVLSAKQTELKENKKHFHMTDERFLREAERLLHEEFAFVLDIPVSEVSDYVEAKIKSYS